MSHIYDVTDLGSPAGVTFNQVRVEGLNDHGQVVGSFLWAPTSPFAWPFLWHATTGLVELPAHLDLPEHVHCLPLGINSAGSIAGMFRRPGVQVWDGFRWDPHSPNGSTGTSTPLAMPPDTDTFHVIGINSSGHVLGDLQTGTKFGPVLWNSPTQQPAFLWPQSDLTYHAASDWNDHGQVVGAIFRQGRMRPFLLQPQAGSAPGAVHDLSDASTAADGGRASAINRHGQIVGSVHSIDSPLWRWKPSAPNGVSGSSTTAGMVGQTCHAHAINASGTAVGFLQGVAQRACIYWPRPSDLNDWILPSAGWVLENATAINDAGWIAGTGRLAGSLRAFLLRPTAWKPLQLAFLRYVVRVIVGVRLDDGGIVFPPGRGPDPVPPWVNRVWERSSSQQRATLRALALQDGTRLLADRDAHARLLEIVPELAHEPPAAKKSRED